MTASIQASSPPRLGPRATADPPRPTDRAEGSGSRAVADYACMVRIRAFEERVAELAANHLVPGAVHLAAGQEAVAVGVCAHLGDDDHLTSTHRGHGHAIAKGCDLTGLFAEILGRASGVCGGYGGSMHVADFNRGMLGANGVAAGGVPMALGAALSAKQLDRGTVAVAFLGDGAVNQGVFAECLTLAAVWQLPVVFVVEDNGYAQATGSAFHLQGIPVRDRSAAHGVPGRTVDGADYAAVTAAAGWAIGLARSGAGPALLECPVARLFGHMEGFDQQAYRGPGELERERRDRDPIPRLRHLLKREHLQTTAQLDALTQDVVAEVGRAAEEALAAPFPDPADLTAHVYTPARGVRA